MSHESRRDPETSAAVLLALAILTTVFLGYWEYSRESHAHPLDLQLLVQGLGPAPQQYRIGVIQIARILQTHLHLAMWHSFALFDLLTATIAVTILFRLLLRSAQSIAASSLQRWVASATFASLVAFYLPWSLWYIRPETLTTCACMALLLWCLTAGKGRQSVWLRVLITLLVAGVQAMVRADIVIFAELGVAAVCVLRPVTGLALHRFTQAATSTAAVLLAGGVQLYLEHVVYPHASYGSTPVFQGRLNLTQPGRWLPFVVVMLPYAWFLRQRAAWADRDAVTHLEIATRVWLPGSLLYLGAFLVLGKMDEVRIFLPLLLTLTPGMALLIMQQAGIGDGADQRATYS